LGNNQITYLSRIKIIPDSTEWIVFHINRSTSGDVDLWVVNESGVEREVVVKDPSQIALVEPGLSSDYSSEFETISLLCEAQRISKASITDPFSAVNSSKIRPLPHQLTAVYKILLNMDPIRFVLADDPGAGKTIMSGLLIREMLIRKRANSILIVAPGGLSENWHSELQSKFGLDFGFLDVSQMAVDHSYFQQHRYLIAKLDTLARSKNLRAILAQQKFDLTIMDEAHKLSATVFGGEIKYTDRFRLGRVLSESSKNFLLLTATPHDGKPDDFRLLMSLIDKEKYQEKGQALRMEDVNGNIRRVVKEDMIDFDGKPLFPERETIQSTYILSGPELSLYDDVTQYARKQFNLAQKLSNSRKTCVGFVMTLLQRRLASSPKAIYLTLKRREDRLTKQMEDIQNGIGDIPTESKPISTDDDFVEEDEDSDESSLTESETAANNVEELKEEIDCLHGLVAQAKSILDQAIDAKWNSLSKLLQDNFVAPNSEGKYEKLIIFTENADTLDYLNWRVASVIGSSRVLFIKGGMSEKERNTIKDRFWTRNECQVLLATDAAGEGINLHCAHFLLNYDLPWNPNRLEQRFGRIHRIGQTYKCVMFNMVAENTREGQVFTTLFKKIEEEKKALGGQIYNVLGDLKFDGKTLSQVLSDIVLGKAEFSVAMSSNGQELQNIVEKNKLFDSSVTKADADRMLAEVNETRPDKIQPYVLKGFLLKAWKWFGATIIQNPDLTYTLPSVPVFIRSGSEKNLQASYPSIYFDPDQKVPDSSEFIGLSSPITLATINAVLSHCSSGDASCLAVDPKATAEDCSIIQKNEAIASFHGQAISDLFHFWRADEPDPLANVSPYLDLVPLSGIEPSKMALWLAKNKTMLLKEEGQLSLSAGSFLASFGQEATKNQIAAVDKTIAERRKGIADRINEIDLNVFDLENSDKVDEGTQEKIEKLKKEKDSLSLVDESLAKSGIKPSDILVTNVHPVPRFLVVSQSAITKALGADAKLVDLKKQDEILAMKAVASNEKSLGYLPLDTSAVKDTGYDIISQGKENGKTVFRRIEVKGIQSANGTVDCTRNEINRGLNDPENFILAICRIFSDKISMTYLKSPFDSLLDKYGSKGIDEMVKAVTFDLDSLLANSEIVFKKDIPLPKPE
jgi:superfamily II DNA or RNA helicase